MYKDVVVVFVNICTYIRAAEKKRRTQNIIRVTATLTIAIDQSVDVLRHFSAAKI